MHLKIQSTGAWALVVDDDLAGYNPGHVTGAERCWAGCNVASSEVCRAQPVFL